MRFLIFVALAYLLYRVARGLLVLYSGSNKKIQENGEGSIDIMVQDPICKTYISKTSAVKRTIEDEVYYFCSRQCAEKFEK
jgi:uncharacterized protein